MYENIFQLQNDLQKHYYDMVRRVKLKLIGRYHRQTRILDQCKEVANNGKRSPQRDWNVPSGTQVQMEWMTT